jgi:hypothetical protein
MSKVRHSTPAKSKRLTKSLRAAGSLSAAAAPSMDLRNLAAECFQIAAQVLMEFGLSRQETAAAMKRAMYARRKIMLSIEILRRYRQVGQMINFWRGDKRFKGADGPPKVIPIYGRGATFETLAHKFAPGAPIEQLVDFVCHHGDATRSTKNTLALVGSNVLIYAKSPEVTMAALNDNFRKLAGTFAKNTKIPKGQKASGLFQRTVDGFLSEKNFLKFAKDIRPQLQDLCNVVEAGLEDGRRPKGRDNRYCGMSLYLFQDCTDYYSRKDPRIR